MGHHFTNFVVAQSNRFAHAAARAVAESPAKAYNPLIIWGAQGVGKTHLLRAIYHFTSALHTDLKVKWVTGDTMVEAFTSHPDEGERGAWFTEQKKDIYAQSDVLLIDDVQEFAPEDKQEARSALLDVIERMFDSNRQVVMAADRSPDEIGDLAHLMRNYEWGLIVDIAAPDTETRLEIENLQAVLRAQQKRQLDPIDYRITREWSIEHAAYMYVFYKILYRGYIPPSRRESKEELLLSPVAVGDREWALRNATHFGTEVRDDIYVHYPELRRTYRITCEWSVPKAEYVYTLHKTTHWEDQEPTTARFEGNKAWAERNAAHFSVEIEEAVSAAAVADRGPSRL
ncbi:hypothetical protein CQY20_31965 [Mycolicibacterium agri]|uniref:AAA+ ATPase domain-containing protein n=1 Tax=Mycolicibacterium agri TaxID=36811 RepID=A0A2A7MNF6_MYCAG|nr:DnaA/Hda family protein [Mycolicibacterium agri]PEG33214.1 hypothetical protein CQY20_31965 [Mycolicibacterium agri]GFG50144.1 hypothetical protein MAGR_15850 [Mycolicibacterium agri]